MPNHTANTIACPNCNQSVPREERRCPYCQSDLAIAALIAERSLIRTPIDTDNQRIAPELLVPRLGEYLINEGLITPEGLQNALNIQGEREQSGEPVLIGELLVELGYINRDILDQVITLQVFQLQAALAESVQHLEERVQTRTSQLQNTLIKLTEINQLKQNFISNVSHELRMPMQFLVGYLDLFSNGSFGELSGEQAKVVASMQKTTQQLKQLIEDLLLYSSVADGDLPLDLAPIPLEVPVNTAVTQSQTKARARQIFLKNDLPPHIPKVVADNQKITWVVEQFLDNAIKFTPPGGKVQIRTTPYRGDVIVRVIDTGIGIPPERINEIFQAFHQLDGSPTRHHRGTGLGLALARTIVEAHGSTIQVATKVGEGSCFSFALPAID